MTEFEKFLAEWSKLSYQSMSGKPVQKYDGQFMEEIEQAVKDCERIAEREVSRG